MGLFSFLSKNKQDGARADSGVYSSDEPMERARSKRASYADGDAADPVLPEKKRARRRLVGAIALALGVAVGLPMILDTEPKPLSSDIAIQIPAKDKPAAAAASAVAASDALDPSEELITAPLKRAPAVAPAMSVASEPVAAVTARAEPLAKGPMPLVIEAPREAPREAPKTVAKVEPKISPKAEPRHEVLQEKSDSAKASDDAARAMAILEGKPSPKAAPEHGAKFALQIAALATQDKVDELQSRLKEAGIHSYTQKTSTAGGERIRVRLGPFASKEEAEKARSKLANIGLTGSLVPL